MTLADNTGFLISTGGVGPNVRNEFGVHYVPQTRS